MHIGCPYCGYRSSVGDGYARHILRPHTVLCGKYMIGRVLGEGGCGITYLGYDLNLEIKIAIKEYYPSGFVARNTGQGFAVTALDEDKRSFFEDGKKKVIHEARILAKLSGLQGIVSVRDYFEENNTSYIIMEYLDGETLKSYLARMGGKLPLPAVMTMMKPVLESLGEVHRNGMIHRDISPDNIMILKNGSTKLLDFGSARDMVNDVDRSTSVMLKPGYAPEEQYRAYGAQGPWTDVYAVCATIYKCLTGITPVDALSRMKQDLIVPPSAYGVMLAPGQEAALLRGLAVYSEQRFKTLGEFYQAFYYGNAPGTGNTYMMQPNHKKASGLSIAIAVAAVAAVVLVAVAVLVFVGGGKRSKGRDESTPADGQLAQNQTDMQTHLTDEGSGGDGTSDGQTGGGGQPAVREDAQGNGGIRGFSQRGENESTSQNGIPTLCYELPESFTMGANGMYYAPDYPEDTANINIMTMENDTVTFQYTEESFCEAVEALYDSQYGYQVDVECSEFTRTTISGCNVLLIRTSYDLAGVGIEQIQCAVETEKDKVTTITFTQLAGGEWMDEFNKVIDTLRIEYR